MSIPIGSSVTTVDVLIVKEVIVIVQPEEQRVIFLAEQTLMQMRENPQNVSNDSYSATRITTEESRQESPRNDEAKRSSNENKPSDPSSPAPLQEKEPNDNSERAASSRQSDHGREGKPSSGERTLSGGSRQTQHHSNEGSGGSPPPPNQEPSDTDQPKSSRFEGKADGATEKPGEKVEGAGGEEGPRDIKDIAKQIAKELIPEKFNFLLATIPFRFQHMPLPKEERAPQEDSNPNQKGSQDKSRSIAKGEAKTLQEGVVPEEIEPAQKSAQSNPNHNQNNPNQLPNSMGQNRPWGEKGFQSLQNFSNFMGYPRSLGKEGQPFFVNSANPQLNQEFVRQQGYQQPAFLQHHSAEGGKMFAQNQQNPTLAAQQGLNPQMAGKMQTPVNNGNSVVQQPAQQPNNAAKDLRQPQAIGKIGEVNGHRSVHARRDAIPGIDRNETGALKHKNGEEGTPVRFPVLPELPNPRDGVSKDKAGRSNLNIREDDGFRLGDLVLMVLCGVVCNARNSVEIAAYLQGREAFFKAWLGLKKGLPSNRLLAMVLNWLEPSLTESLIYLALGKKRSSLQHILVWETDRGMILGELKEDSQVNGGSPLSEVLAHFDLKGAKVIINADNLKKDLSRQIKSAGGEYLIAIKGKHGTPYEQVQEYFYEKVEEKLSTTVHHHYQDSFQEKKVSMLREFFVVEDTSWFVERDGWTGLRSTLQFKSQAITENKTASETRYYLSSLRADGAIAAQTLRIHTILENKVAWHLDIDLTQSAVDHKLENFDLLRSFSWDLLNSETTNKIEPDAKRRKAKVDNSYLRLLLGAA